MEHLITTNDDELENPETLALFLVLHLRWKNPAICGNFWHP
jgi:hypothetical protein